MMEGVVGILGIVSLLLGFVLFVCVLSLAIDAARLLRRADKITGRLDEATRYLAAISANIARAAEKPAAGPG